MPASSVSLLRNDGLYLRVQATLQQLAGDTAVAEFANGLLAAALEALPSDLRRRFTLVDALVQANRAVYPLLTALLVLDAAVDTVVDDERRVFPLPGYLSYRHRLPVDRYPLNTMRLPPLNPGGHYHLQAGPAGEWAAVRLDLHPRLKVTGHVRMAVGSADRLPVRLLAAEHRLDRQVLDEAMITHSLNAAATATTPPLTAGEYNLLRDILQRLLHPSP